MLNETYGSPRHDNKDDPLDELVFILLSQMTTGPSFNRIFDRLKAGCGTWEAALAMPLSRIKRLIRGAGLSNQKAPRIKAALAKVKADFGEVTLDALRGMDDAEAETYLTTFPGVGVKTAKCILMCSLGRRVLPADTHVWRVSRRLGLVPASVPYPKVHAALEGVVPPPARYSLHVNGLAHGRAVCLALRPRCTSCPLRRLCPYPKAASPIGAV